ncbi:ABC-type phosphate/phosphonate transport system substrate-binding protein [Silvimonas terrae]|uniref:ABC-type phosphate/phosphonate transport system substrate-binding protein n=1 Tax=Silvimonas terrae TaxID=300266 RepID=A0A840RKF5_9NEIS|nr:PhnD/SsuA/transferrin family substrate-binding protein [Silvimonas terrae]MBB5192712.1 ABC-type phosphate/phosphonate transport system substrate-binding protein [Silvimonas terrae]
MKVSLPMYFAGPGDTARLWLALKAELINHEITGAPEEIIWPDHLVEHWLDPDLLLSQTCSYPLMTVLKDKVQSVGYFHYDAEGCDGPFYCSMLVVRATDKRISLTDFRGATVAYNSRDSHSGYNSLRALIAPLSVGGQFFGRAVATGSHARSIEFIRDNQADIAAIDCVTLALLQRHQPEAATGIRVIGQTAPSPGLPLITALSTSPDQLWMMRLALAHACANPDQAAALAPFGITGFSVLPDSVCNVVAEMEQEAADYGYLQL